jgi:hypothetical protein
MENWDRSSKQERETEMIRRRHVTGRQIFGSLLKYYFVYISLRERRCRSARKQTALVPACKTPMFVSFSVCLFSVQRLDTSQQHYLHAAEFLRTITVAGRLTVLTDGRKTLQSIPWQIIPVDCSHAVNTAIYTRKRRAEHKLYTHLNPERRSTASTFTRSWYSHCSHSKHL